MAVPRVIGMLQHIVGELLRSTSYKVLADRLQNLVREARCARDVVVVHAQQRRPNFGGLPGRRKRLGQPRVEHGLRGGHPVVRVYRQQGPEKAARVLRKGAPPLQQVPVHLPAPDPLPQELGRAGGDGRAAGKEHECDDAEAPHVALGRVTLMLQRLLGADVGWRAAGLIEARPRVPDSREAEIRKLQHLPALRREKEVLELEVAV
eukprot:CAMPEP_0179365224 /NCGR_PEP_ID=MMETSP0797-20121207/82440_1 /TAXON_ID=47934 /ORGANISM="Dinophysis acuminata, Strain DAEP01" /LENGTH=205 /DNA_ID=CAMNT_0021080719 /DNA_START=107 /DNA_END=721 /DNA_ORIENTATION=-